LTVLAAGEEVADWEQGCSINFELVA